MRQNNIVLIGMPGSGKSTLGVVLAKKLALDFTDMDLVIQQREGQTLSALIDRYGIEGFLDIEGDVNGSFQPERRSVLATGGSVIYRDKAMAHLKTLGPVVYLQLDFPALEGRLQSLKDRGVAIPQGMTLRELYDQRIPLYEKYADHTLHECEDFSRTLQRLTELCAGLD